MVCVWYMPQKIMHERGRGSLTGDKEKEQHKEQPHTVLVIQHTKHHTQRERRKNSIDWLWRSVTPLSLHNTPGGLQIFIKPPSLVTQNTTGE